MNPFSSLEFKFHCSFLPISALLVTETEKAMATHSSILAWKIPWTEEPGGLHSMGSRRVGHDWVTSLWLFTFMHWRRKWQPAPVFLPGESQDSRAWWAAVYGAAQSWTRLKRLSSSNRKPSTWSGSLLLLWLLYTESHSCSNLEFTKHLSNWTLGDSIHRLFYWEDN